VSSPLILIRTALLSMALLLFTQPDGGAANAHEIRPTIADVEVTTERVTQRLRIALEPIMAGIDQASITDTNDAPEAAIHDQLRRLAPDGLEAALRADWGRVARGFIIEVQGARIIPEIDDVAIPAVGNAELPRDSILTISAALPPGVAPVQVGLAAGYGTFVPRQMGGGDSAYEGFLAGGELTPPLPRIGVLDSSAEGVFLSYLVAGVQYIIPFGFDHVLFVFGLFLFAARIGPLVWQVSAFTVAHSLTLALATTGVISVPANIVEALIAASLIYIGIENALGWGSIRTRSAAVFAFGLLHGLGFAHILGDFGVATDRFALALVGFNVGIELGQLAVLVLAFLTVGWFAGKSWYRSVIAVPASLLIAAAGIFWVVERAALW
jgi:hypothetical protein